MENKKLEILVVEDEGFDTSIHPLNAIKILNKDPELLFRYSEGKCDIKNGKWDEKIYSELKARAEEDLKTYNLIPKRLEKALKEKGYDANITIERDWNEGKKVLLPNYDVIISDLGFPGDLKLSKEEVENLVKEKKKEIEKAYNAVIHHPWLYPPKYSLGVNLQDLAFDRSDVYESLAKKSENYGFLRLGNHAKELRRKITFYTDGLGHAHTSIPLGLITGLITPEEFEDVANANIDGMNKLSFSRSKRLCAGYKYIFENWVNVIEESIKYQMKGGKIKK